MKRYDHIVSLGYFFSVATELNRIGLRDLSLPFDWCIADFSGVVYAIETKFDSFLEYQNMVQNSKRHQIYKDELYNIQFFHDFTKYSPLLKQIVKVKEKYDRRIQPDYWTYIV